MTDGAYTLGYWNIRGLAAPIRLAFALAGKPLNEDEYTCELVDDKWVNNWSDIYKEMQSSNSHPFPNLPYLKFPDGKTTIVQSNAIMRHIGREFKLYGDDAITMARVDEVLERVNDMRMEATKNYYATAISKDFVEEVLPYYFSTLEKYLEKHNTRFFCCDTPTIADCAAYEALRTALPLVPHFAEEFKRINEIIKRFESLPQLEKYFTSREHKFPANNRMASFGGSN